jgi:hypothetical protein
MSMKRIKLRWCLALPVALMLALTLGSTRALAASPAQSITISPTSIDQSVQPGSLNTGSFEIINSGSTNYTFRVYATPYGVSGENYNPEFTPIPGAPNITSWFHFSTTTAQVGVRQVVTVNYTIHVPSGTLAKGYYAVAFAQTQPKTDTKTGVVVTDRVGEIFYLRVAGNVTQGGKLLSWQTSFLQKPPITPMVRIEDSGAYNFPSIVTIHIKNVFGRTVYTVETTKQILPQTIRRIETPWAKSPSIGLFKVSGSAQFLNHTYQLPTKYVLVMSQTVRIIVVVIIVLIVIALIYRRSRAHGRKR